MSSVFTLAWVSLCYTNTEHTNTHTCTHTLRKWKINVVNNACFNWSVETGVKMKWVICVCRFKCVDGLSHFQLRHSQSQPDSPVWNAAQYLMKPPQISINSHCTKLHNLFEILFCHYKYKVLNCFIFSLFCTSFCMWGCTFCTTIKPFDLKIALIMFHCSQVHLNLSVWKSSSQHYKKIAFCLLIGGLEYSNSGTNQGKPF